MQLLLSIALPLILIYLIIHKTRNKHKTLAPPGPRGLPFIGNLLQFAAATDPHLYLWKLSQKHGPIMQLKLGSAPLLVLSSAKSAKEALKTHDRAFSGRPKLHGQERLSYNASDMVFAPYGDYWREVRKITSLHLFSIRKTQSFRPVREDEVSRMLGKIRSARGAADNSSFGVNLSAVAMALSTALICGVAFGRRYEEGGDERRRFDEVSREAQGLMAAFYVKDYFPWLGWVDRVSGLMDRLERGFWELDSFYEELIGERRRRKTAAEGKGKGKEEGDILGVLIKLKEENSSSIEIGWDNIKALLMVKHFESIFYVFFAIRAYISLMENGTHVFPPILFL